MGFRHIASVMAARVGSSREKLVLLCLADYASDDDGQCWPSVHSLTTDERSQAIAALPAFRAHCQQDPTYRPVHACRFLSQRRAEGFLDPSRPTGHTPSIGDGRAFGERTAQWGRTAYGEPRNHSQSRPSGHDMMLAAFAKRAAMHAGPNSAGSDDASRFDDGETIDLVANPREG